MSTTLSDEEFWANYWASLKLPSEVNPDFSFERCLLNAFSKYLPAAQSNKTFFEVGCAPGRWLAYFSKHHNMTVSGVDYSKLGVQKTLENLHLLNVQADVGEMDFFQMNSSKTYDIVMSLGFIEHFAEQNDVIQRHLKLVKPNGLLVLGIPNFRGVYQPIQSIYNNDILLKHNLSIMSLEYFKSLAKTFDLDIVYLDYIGGFEPTLFVKPPKLTLAKNLLIRGPLALAARIRRLSFFDNINHPFISSYILCILRTKSG